MPLVRIQHHHVHHHHGSAAAEFGEDKAKLIHNERVKLWATFCMSTGYVVGTALVVAIAAAFMQLVPNDSGSFNSMQIAVFASALAAGAGGFMWVGWFSLRRLRG